MTHYIPFENATLIENKETKIRLNTQVFIKYPTLDSVLQQTSEEIREMFFCLTDMGPLYYHTLMLLVDGVEGYLAESGVRIEYNGTFYDVEKDMFEHCLRAIEMSQADGNLERLTDNYCISYELGPYNPEKYFMNPFQEKKVESGQQKIMVGVMTPFVGLDKNKKISVCVVGSAAPQDTTYSGSSYIVLARALTAAGYSGEFNLYDPMEREGVIEVGNFTMKYHAECFDYEKNEGRYDVLLDDALGTILEEVSDTPLEGMQKFVIDSAGRYQYTRRSHAATTLQYPIAGGSIYVKDGVIYQSKQGSTHYGDPDNPPVYPGAKMCAELGPRSIDPFNLALKVAPRYSIKWPSPQGLQDHEYEPQYFYQGAEVRRTYPPFQSRRQGSNTCQWCYAVYERMEQIGIPFDWYDEIRSLGTSCCPIDRIKSLEVRTFLRGAARRNTPIYIAVRDIAKKVQVGHGRVEEEIKKMRQQNTLIGVPDTTPYLSLHRSKMQTNPIKNFMKMFNIKFKYCPPFKEKFPALHAQLMQYSNPKGATATVGSGCDLEISYGPFYQSQLEDEIFSDVGWKVHQRRPIFQSRGLKKTKW